MHDNPWDEIGFQMQICCLIIAPVSPHQIPVSRCTSLTHFPGIHHCRRIPHPETPRLDIRRRALSDQSSLVHLDFHRLRPVLPYPARCGRRNRCIGKLGLHIRCRWSPHARWYRLAGLYLDHLRRTLYRLRTAGTQEQSYTNGRRIQPPPNLQVPSLHDRSCDCVHHHLYPLHLSYCGTCAWLE